MKNIFLCNTPSIIGQVYPNDVIEALKAEAFLDTTVLTEKALNNDIYADTEAIFASWDIPRLSVEQIAHHFPNLKYVFYAAGSVQYFAKPFFERNVRIFSAWSANAVPVAEYTLAQIILANKGFFHTINKVNSKAGYLESREETKALPGNYKTTIGILGVGQIGRRVIEKLHQTTTSIIKVYDPFLSDEAARESNVQKASLEEIFSTCQTISNHIANLPTTQKLLNYNHFSLMKDNAVFINTGRGAQVDVDGLIKALKENPSRFAVLDVTDPEEPPNDNHEFYQMGNVLITPHIAGSSGNEVHRMAEIMLEAFRAVKSGNSTHTEVTLDMLSKMA
ncbi:MAG: hydroxyacid dehydrogenase [Kiritimatiellae bacterium]|nr:hydroxyacid dehydrogenase [Kiritimatiellia bacterium]